MKKMIVALILFSAVSDLQAVTTNFNSITISGELNSPTPISGVRVWIRSGGSSGAVVGTASEVSLIPDAGGFFSTQTYITDPGPWIFQTGSDYVVQLTSSTNEIISTFSITAVPFALTVRGDAQPGNQNIFGAYGNVGIGTTTPSYRLHVTSAAGTGGDMLVVSTGASNVIRMTGAGGIYANKFYGDGSSLTGVTGVGDNLGNHTATTYLNMANNSITNASLLNANSGLFVGSGGGSQLYVFDGKVGIGTTEPRSALEVVGLISIDTGTYSVVIGPNNGSAKTQRNIFIGSYVGSNSTGGKNLFVGYNSGGANSTGYENVFLGDYSGSGNSTGLYNNFTGSHSGMVNTEGYSNNFYGAYSGLANTTGHENTFIGYEAGKANTTGTRNVFIGDTAGKSNTTGNNNILIGYVDVDGPSSNSRLNIGNLIYGDLAAKTIGISTRVPQAALDIVSTGTAITHFSQIWRDSNGVIKSSMSANGIMMADKFIGDGSSLTGVIASGGVLKTGDTMTGQLTLSNSTLTISGSAFSVGGSTFAVSNGAVATGKEFSVGGSTLSINHGTVFVGYPAFAHDSGLYLRNANKSAQMNIYTGSALADNVGISFDMEGTGASNIGTRIYAAGGTSNKAIEIQAGGPPIGANNYAIRSLSQAQTTFAGSDFSIGGSTFVVTNGKVGIGVASPSSPLEIATSGTGVQEILQLRNTAAGSSSNISRLQFLNQTTGAGSALRNALDMRVSYTTVDNNTRNSLVSFYTDNAGTAEATFNILGGNVGIGTTVPGAKLDVNGSISAASNIWSSGTVTASLFNGSGASLSALNASSLANGTVSDSRLSSNVGLLASSQTFTGQPTFADGFKADDASGQTFFNHYSTAAVVLVMSGMEVNTDVIVSLVRVGNAVTMTVPSITAKKKNGSPGGLSLSGIPAAYCPTSLIVFGQRATINATAIMTYFELTTGGVLSMSGNLAGAAIPANQENQAWYSDITFSWAIK